MHIHIICIERVVEQVTQLWSAYPHPLQIDRSEMQTHAAFSPSASECSPNFCSGHLAPELEHIHRCWSTSNGAHVQRCTHDKPHKTTTRFSGHKCAGTLSVASDVLRVPVCRLRLRRPEALSLDCINRFTFGQNGLHATPFPW